MKFLIPALLGLCLAAPAAAAFEDEGLSETIASTDTAKSAEEEEEQPLVQERDEDLAAFVTDYIRKDIQLKGAFFLEDRASKKLFRMELASVESKAQAGENGARAVAVTLKDAAGKKHKVLFWVQAGPWGGLDIFRIDFRLPGAKQAPELRPAPAKKGNK